MKRTCAFILALLMFLLTLASCGDNTPSNPDGSDIQPPDVSTGDPNLPSDSDNDGDKKDNESDVTGDPTLSPGSSGTATPVFPETAGPAYNIVVWGDAVISTNSPIDTMCALARADGRNVSIKAKTHDNLGETTTYSLYELFNWDGTSASSNITSVKSAEFINLIQKPVDCLVLLTSRDRSIATTDGAARNSTAFAEVQKLYYQSNPNGKIVLLVPMPYKDTTCEVAQKYLPQDTDIDTATHNDLIREVASNWAVRATGTVAQARIGDAFNYFNNNHGDTGIELYDKGGVYQSIAGAYYMSCILYSAIFGESPASIPEYGMLDKDTATLLQNAAHKFYFHSDASEVKKDTVPLTHASYQSLDPRTMEYRDPRFKDEVYPEYFNEFFATAYAYEAFGGAVQYDQYAISPLSGSPMRLTTTGISPASLTPQRITYLDCTWYCHSVFKSAFNHTIKESVSTKVIDIHEGEVFRWVGTSPDAIPADDAAAQLISLLRPGDMIMYFDRAARGGHGVLYIGNGMILHCSSSSHIGGGKADYNFKANIDAKEPLGGVVFAPLDLLLEKDNGFTCFSERNEVSVLRPLSLGLKPTNDASIRAKNLAGIICYKETTASGGITVNPGDDVTFTYVIRNDNNTEKTVLISDKIPANTSFKSGEVTFENGTLNMTAAVPAGQTLRLSFTVTVSSTVKPGAVIACGDTAIGGITLMDTPIYVNTTLTAAEQQKIASSKVSAGSSDELISKTYAEIGRTVELGDSKSLAASICAVSAYNSGSATGGDNMQFALNSGKDTMLLVQNLFGGRGYRGDFDGNRIKHISTANLMCGDILCVMETSDTAETYLYIGKGEFKTVRDGQVVTIPAGTSVSLMDGLFGGFGFFVLRPSLGF